MRDADLTPGYWVLVACVDAATAIRELPLHRGAQKGYFMETTKKESIEEKKYV
jgi:hypothetical protein